ncbi:MAG: hypothetical protein ACK5RO_04545, partial [Pseudobdellovibrionaceae bacterium]
AAGGLAKATVAAKVMIAVAIILMCILLNSAPEVGLGYHLMLLLFFLCRLAEIVSFEALRPQ